MPPITLFSYEECVVRYISSLTEIVFKCGFFSPAMATTGELFFFQCTMRASEDMFGKLEVANYCF